MINPKLCSISIRKPVGWFVWADGMTKIAVYKKPTRLQRFAHWFVFGWEYESGEGNGDA